MPVIEQFSPPANWDDFRDAAPEVRARFRRQWSENLDRWTLYAITGNPWTSRYDDDRSYYFNPLTFDIPKDGQTVVASTLWPTFSHRLEVYATSNGFHFTPEQILEFGDYGRLADGTPLPGIPVDECNQSNHSTRPWTPPGPRGWQEEYCEWAVERDGETILAVEFTCENPEYWNTLWKFDHDRVCALYNEILNAHRRSKVVVKLEDLFLRLDGRPVIDPETGYPAYDPINRWNNGPQILPDRGGAVHLTCPINSLLAEVYEGAQGTTLRTFGDRPVPAASDTKPILTARELICLGKIGGADRNSDPHIVQTVNQLVREKFKVTIADPVGLYIHPPDFSRYKLPEGKVHGGLRAEDCWTITRGEPGMTLHAVFRVPEGQDFTINEIAIDGKPIRYAGQIAQTFDIGIKGLAVLQDSAPTDYPAVIDLDPGSATPTQPLLDATIFRCQSPIRIQLSYQPPKLPQGAKDVEGYVLPCTNLKDGATVEFTGSGVTAEVTGVIPASDVESQTPALILRISVTGDAEPGNRGAIVRNPADSGPIVPAPGILEVVESS